MSAEYLRFVEVESFSPKTRRWRVESVNSKTVLGCIGWYPQWRQYVFWPEPETAWNQECLRRLADECRRRTEDHREALRAERSREADADRLPGV